MAMAAATKTDLIITVVMENLAMGRAVPWVSLLVVPLVVAVAVVGMTISIRSKEPMVGVA